MGPLELNNVRKPPPAEMQGDFFSLCTKSAGHFRHVAAGKRDLNHRLCDFFLKRSIINDQYFQLKKGTKKAKYYTSTKTSKTIKKLAKKKTYSVKIRSYKKISGKTYYGT